MSGEQGVAISGRERWLKRILISLCVLGIAARVYVSWWSIGSNDAVNWFHSAQTILAEGLVDSYVSDEYLNNPPLISLLVARLLVFADQFHLPFPFVLRCLGIAGELLVVVLLVLIGNRRPEAKRYSGWLLAAVFALNPLSILVTGYHGHTDGLCGALALLAFCMWATWRESFWAGFFLGAAMNVKLIPLLLAPALFCSVDSWQERVKCAIGIGLACLSFVVMYYYGGQDFYERVFGYRSILDYWGLQTFLIIGQTNYPQLSNISASASSFFQSMGPYLILTLVTVLNLMVRLSVYERVAVSYAVFAVFAPGFSITYPALFMPFFVLVAPWWSLQYSFVNALTLLSVYRHFLVSEWPWQTVHVGSSPHGSVLGMFVMWVMLVYFAVDRVIKSQKLDLEKSI